MAGIYIASTTANAGKSFLAFSLGVLLQRAGKTVGYMKPVGRNPRRMDDADVDADALVAQEVLGQRAPTALLSPVMSPENLHALTRLERGDVQASMRRIRDAFERISLGKDVTLVAGCGAFPSTGRVLNADGLTIVRDLRLKILFVERYDGSFNFDHLLLLRDALASSLLGVVLNDVSETEQRDVENLLVPWLEARGIPVLGVVGHEPGLSIIRIIDLARGLDGRVVAGNAQNAGSVEGFLIGTMQVDNFMLRLRRKPGSAVIVGGDRTDLQLAALHAGSPCIIMTGNIRPSELILKQAQEKGVTLVTVREDTYDVAQAMTRILRSKKIRELPQIRLAVARLEKSLPLATFLDLTDSE
jgi:BioD-like phosphotransacetylase family protein